MNFIDEVLKGKAEKGVTNGYIADKVGFSRQRLEGIIAAGDCNINTAVAMLEAVGKRLVIVATNEEAQEKAMQIFNTVAENKEKGLLPDTMKEFEDNRIMYSAAEKIIGSVGLVFDVMDISDLQSSDSAPKEEKS